MLIDSVSSILTYPEIVNKTNRRTVSGNLGKVFETIGLPAAATPQFNILFQIFDYTKLDRIIIFGVTKTDKLKPG